MTFDQIFQEMIEKTLQETKQDWFKISKNLTLSELEAMTHHEMKKDCDFLSPLFSKGEYDEAHL